MLVSEAKIIAKQWVMESAADLPGFQGAFFHGSVNWMPEDAVLSPTSDVDVMVVLPGEELPEKPGKFIYRDLMLEVSYIAARELESPEGVLSRSDLAGSFAAPSVILDPSGDLSRLQREVSREYARRRWVEARCAHAESKIVRNLDSIGDAGPFHDQVTAWLFGTGVTTHMLLVAGLENATVRKRYSAVRALLQSYGRLDFYAPLLSLLGCERMNASRVEMHLKALAVTFDAASAAIRTPFFFAADITPAARSVAIDGSQELISRGEHREAVFWIVATYARCLAVLHRDAPIALFEQSEAGLRNLLADLDIATTGDLLTRADVVRAFLPQIWDVATEIMDRTPRITD
jgi:hypothetical protein